MRARLGELDFGMFYNPGEVANLLAQGHDLNSPDFLNLQPAILESKKEQLRRLRAHLALLQRDPSVSHEELRHARVKLGEAHMRLYEVGPRPGPPNSANEPRLSTCAQESLRPNDVVAAGAAPS